MKKLVWLVVLVGLGFGAKVGLEAFFAEGERHTAEERVRRVLDGLQSPGKHKEQAVPMWAEGVFSLPGGMEAFMRAADGFEAWARAKKLETISGYEIVGSEIEVESDGVGGAVVLVDVTIDGEPYTIRSVKGRALEWVG